MAALRVVWIYWKLAIFRAIGKAWMAIVLAVAQALNGAEWSSFTPTQKFVCVALACGTGWSIIDAFLDTTLAEIKQHPHSLDVPNGKTHIQTNIDTKIEKEP